MTEHRDQQIHFRVSKVELERIRQKMESCGILSIGSYLRKNGSGWLLYQTGFAGCEALVSLLRICSNNLNQYAKRANETGSIYRADIEDLQKRLEEIWTDMRESSCSPVLNPVIRQLVGKSQFRLRLLHKG